VAAPVRSAYGLADAGARVTVFNRTATAGETLADSVGCAFGGPPEEVIGDAFDILAHATPVGFHAPDDMLVSADVLRPGMVVFDAVPMPIETRLLREAAARGCATIPGVRMQLHQAARQFALFTGQEPDLSVMEAALLEVMDGG